MVGITWFFLGMSAKDRLMQATGILISTAMSFLWETAFLALFSPDTFDALSESLLWVMIFPILAIGIASFFLEIRCYLKLGIVHRLFRWAGYALLSIIGMPLSSFLAAIAFFVAGEES